MKKLYIVLAIATVLLLPSYAHAAWWNPFSWSWVSTSEKEIPVGAISDTAVGVDLPPAPEEVEPVPDAKVETKVEVRYVADPNLSSQVVALTQDNKELAEAAASLREQVASLKSSLNQCRADVADHSQTTASSPAADEKCDDARDTYTKATNNEISLKRAKQAAIDQYKVQFGALMETTSIDRDYASRLNSASLDVQQAKTSLDLYCR